MQETDAFFVVARLNARVQPLARGDYFEDPLQDALEEAGAGEVTGGGTQLADEPAGIAFCDLEISLPKYSDDAINLIQRRLSELGAPKGSKLIIESTCKEIPFGAAEGLALFLNGTDLPDEVYEKSDVNHVVEEGDRLLGDAGEMRGHWQGSQETALSFYGASYEQMKTAIDPFVASYPLCEKERIERIA